MKKTSAAAGGAEADGGGEKKRGRGRPPKKMNATFKTKKKNLVVVKSVNSSSTISKKTTKKKRGRPPKTPNTKTTTTSTAPEKGIVIRKEFELITTAEKNRLDRGATGGRGRGRGRGGGRGRGRPPALPKDVVLKRLVLQSKGGRGEEARTRATAKDDSNFDGEKETGEAEERTVIGCAGSDSTEEESGTTEEDSKE